MSERELGGSPSFSSVSFVARGSASSIWLSSFVVDSRVITSSDLFCVELVLSKYTNSIGLSFWSFLLGELCFYYLLYALYYLVDSWSRSGFIWVRDFCWVWRRVHEVICIWGCCHLEVGPEGVSRMLNVLIVEDGCILLGVALANDLFSDELQYKSFLFSDLACWLCFRATSFDFCAI